ncbi:hypothetical protein [Lacisediminihabitans sp.]|jgi:hypothetical protein|uniref:hypothetical protein n=1 Tax=Lacisediminihabitans sp. TaxID=2787631 RepID=UPI002F9529B0
MSDSFDTTPAPASAPQSSVPQPTTPPARRKWLTPTLAIVATLAVGLAGGVLIGHATAASAQASGQAGFTRGLGGGGTGGGTGGTGGGDGFAGGGFTAGTIVSVTGSTIVVKTQDGTEKTVTTTGSTKVTKTTASTLADLKAGETVTVMGQASSNGDVTATSVAEGTLRQFGGRLGSGAGAPTAAPSTNG